jgi:hypothetical protein
VKLRDWAKLQNELPLGGSPKIQIELCRLGSAGLGDGRFGSCGIAEIDIHQSNSFCNVANTSSALRQHWVEGST